MQGPVLPREKKIVHFDKEFVVLQHFSPFQLQFWLCKVIRSSLPLRREPEVPACGFGAVCKVYQERGEVCIAQWQPHSREGTWTCALLHVWGRFSPRWRLPVGDRAGCQDLHGEGMGISLHHFLYFLTFELCKYTTRSNKRKTKNPEKIGFLKTFASWTVKTALS